MRRRKSDTFWPAARNEIPLTDEEISIEINNYQRQIDSIRFEIQILQKELKHRQKVKQNAVGKNV